MAYREPAVEQWVPKPGEGWHKAICWAFGCKPKVLIEKTYSLERPNVDRQKDPPDIPHIVQPIVLYWLKGIKYTVHRCTRCHREWLEQSSVPADRPIKYNNYIGISK